MVKRGWDAHVLGVAPHNFKDAKTAVVTLRVSSSPTPGRSSMLALLPGRAWSCSNAHRPSPACT